MRRRVRVLLIGLAVLCACDGVSQQEPQPPAEENELAFEVASIRQSPPGQHDRWSQDAANFKALHQTVADEISYAFGLRARHVVGLPQWALRQPYNFVAKADNKVIEAWAKFPREAQDRQVQQRVRTLLVERCGMKYHWEKREDKVFLLTVDTHGAKLSAAPNLSPGSVVVNDGFLASRGAKASDFASLLETQDEMEGRDVRDKTGLSGIYAFTLRWKSVRSISDTAGPSLFTAIQEELGLRLVPARAPARFLVIDHIEPPSEN